MVQKVRYCTAGRAMKVSVCMVGGCLLLGSMQLYLWTYHSSTETCIVRFSATVGDSSSLFSIWTWITEMLIFLVVPVIILIVNILVMREVCVFHTACCDNSHRVGRGSNPNQSSNVLAQSNLQTIGKITTKKLEHSSTFVKH